MGYYRPILQTGPARPARSEALAGGWTWFSHAELLERGRASVVVPLEDVPLTHIERWIKPLSSLCGLDLAQPQVMGILNTTPDSFSDGGQHFSVDAALKGARRMKGAAILDIGGESTRPGATVVPIEEEINRTVPVIEALRTAGHAEVLSIDTRKAAVADAALAVGANIVNDVSGLTFDANLAPVCAEREVPVCIMHAQGDPATMQDSPAYDDVLLDVYDFLEARIAQAVASGIPRARIIADPGIGFGKTLEHNLTLLARLSLFHSLQVPLLLGASRKRFIGTIGGAEAPEQRVPGSVSVALAALKHGTQIVRVHDVPETLQAIALWRAVVAGQTHG